MIENQRTTATGSTLTEFLVLIGVGSVLAGVLLADLTQTKSNLYKQACAANLKNWGMAIDLYTQDYDGRYFFSKGTYGTFDVGGGYGSMPNPYARYLSINASGDLAAQSLKFQTMRQCPYITRLFSDDQIRDGDAGIGYAMAKPQVKWLAGVDVYLDIDRLDPSPYMIDGSTLPNLKGVPNPAEYLLMMDGREVVTCGRLYTIATQVPAPSGGPPIRAIDRHGGGVNCLFGDFHVEFVSTNTLYALDTLGGCSVSQTGNSWFNMN